jgi:hypothetical protein
MSNDAGKRQQNAGLAEGRHELLNNHTFDPLTTV